MCFYYLLQQKLAASINPRLLVMGLVHGVLQITNATILDLRNIRAMIIVAPPLHFFRVANMNMQAKSHHIVLVSNWEVVPTLMRQVNVFPIIHVSVIIYPLEALATNQFVIIHVTMVIAPLTVLEGPHVSVIVVGMVQIAISPFVLVPVRMVIAMSLISVYVMYFGREFTVMNSIVGIIFAITVVSAILLHMGVHVL